MEYRRNPFRDQGRRRKTIVARLREPAGARDHHQRTGFCPVFSQFGLSTRQSRFDKAKLRIEAPDGQIVVLQDGIPYLREKMIN
jgi:hypothetical protein